MDYHAFIGRLDDTTTETETLLPDVKDAVSAMLLAPEADGRLASIVGDLVARVVDNPVQAQRLVTQVFDGITELAATALPSVAMCSAGDAVGALAGGLSGDPDVSEAFVLSGLTAAASIGDWDLAREIVNVVSLVASRDASPHRQVATAFVTQGVDVAAKFAVKGQETIAPYIFRSTAAVACAVPDVAPAFVTATMNAIPDLVAEAQGDLANRFVGMTQKLVVNPVPAAAGVFLDTGFTAIAKVLAEPDYQDGDNDRAVLRMLENLNKVRWMDETHHRVFLERGTALLPDVSRMEDKAAACYLFATLVRTAVPDVQEDVVCQDFARVADPYFYKAPLVVCFGAAPDQTHVVINMGQHTTLARLKEELQGPGQGQVERYSLFVTSAFTHLANPPADLPTAAEFIRGTPVYKRLVGATATP